MANRPKAKGTQFESACVGFLRERLDDDRIERRALHGNSDMGDIYGLVAHGHRGIVECKNYKEYGPSDLDDWKRQTEDERCNADADFALLVVHRRGIGRRRFGENDCFMQVRDLAKVMGGHVYAGEGALDMWVRVSLEDACRMMEGLYDARQRGKVLHGDALRRR